MADSECELETDGLDLALETLCGSHCGEEATLSSKTYCSAFCALVEEYTGQWQVPLPQLKVLRTALCSFTKATAAFPDDCQHVHYVLSSLALSFFELLLFFSKEEYGEQPLKYIFDSFLECHARLLRHRNIYLHHVKLTIKCGGPWENSILKGILKEEELRHKEVENYLSSELPILLELRVRYLQACERLQEAMALSKCCIENQEKGKHLFFHQAYLTCLYKASLHEHLLKEMAEIDGRDAVEIICNTESVEKDELLLSLSKTFLTQQLYNGDMYYIWDLVFIWSRLYLRAHPSRQEFLSECLSLASSATNVRALFPFIKLVHTELGDEGTQVCVELCARALKLCDQHSDAVTRSLVCKTIAFLLPYDLEMCRACALLVFCQERSLDAYRTVCSLYKHPDDELHPHNSPVRTCIRFHILQKLKEHLCFDPEFWNLLTLRTHCLEMISDKAMQAAVLSEMEEEEKSCEALAEYNCANEQTTAESTSMKISECRDSSNGLEVFANEEEAKPLSETDNVPKRKRGRRRKEEMHKHRVTEEVEPGGDPEFVYRIKPSYKTLSPDYSLRHNHKNRENAGPVKSPLNRKREYLNRCVKSQILMRKGPKRWLQGVQTVDRDEYLKLAKILRKGNKRGRKPYNRVELSFPDNELQFVLEDKSETDTAAFTKTASKEETAPSKPMNNLIEEANKLRDAAEDGDSQTKAGETACVPAVEGDPDLDGPLYELEDSAVEMFHCYCSNSDTDKDEGQRVTTNPKEHIKSKQGMKSKLATKLKGPHKTKNLSKITGTPSDLKTRDTEDTKSEVKAKMTWQEKVIRTQKYSHIAHWCKSCSKAYRGLNVLRHALSHMKGKRKLCILCGRRFKEFSEGSKHVEDHIEEMSNKKTSATHHQINIDNKVKDNVKTDERRVDMVDKSSDQTPDEKLPLTCTDTTQQTTTNGTELPAPSARPEESPKTEVNEEQKPNPKRKPHRFLFTELKREERIVRHARCLFRKYYVLCKTIQYVFPSNFSLTDEQIVIEGGLVILKSVPIREVAVNSKDKDVKNSEKEGETSETDVNMAEANMETEKEAENRDVNRKKETMNLPEKEAERRKDVTKEGAETTGEAAQVKKSGKTEGTSDTKLQEEPPAEEDFISKDFIFHLCPAEDCDKVFFKLGHTMNKHVTRNHLNEDKVLETLFSWSKQRCMFCGRQVNLFPHFKGHMKLHVEHPQYFCYHRDCGQRFESSSELRSHESQHIPLRPQCKYPACQSTFTDMASLYDHEWRHYVPTPQRNDLELGPSNKHKRHNDEAPWKQRVKVEELWLQNKNTQRESVSLRDGVSTEWRTTNELDLCNNESSVKSINGYYENTDPVTQTPKQLCSKNKPEKEPINIKMRAKNLTLQTDTEPSVEEAVIIEHLKSFKPVESPKSAFNNIIRPPPSMYMTENELSMRKRKSELIETPPAKKPPQPFKKQQGEKSENTPKPKPKPEPEPEAKIRHRCEKCLSFFASPEELEKHKSLNTCSALFGFDSDDES